MNKIKIFLNLTRLNKPIGIMLLFWPCSWGLSFAAKNTQEFNHFFYYLILFFLGSVLMRSAGCIFNDIVDKDYDSQVTRTKTRPISSGHISIKRSLFYVIIICSLAFIVLIQFNLLTIFLGMGSMFLAFAYPYMKRFTYWPQLFLGITFNWGIIMSWAAVQNGISQEIIALYISAIFWTLGYDTIYGAQDMYDDEIIGLKSTAIRFKDNIKTFVFSCYFVSLVILIIIFIENFKLNLFTLFFFLFLISLATQIVIFDKAKPMSCMKAFKINNLTGFLLFLGINFL